MFGDIFSMLSQQGPDAWFTTATQLALNIARGDDGDPNPQPIERQLLEALALNGLGIRVTVVTSGDVERELGGGREPGVGALLAQHRKDVAEHVAEGVGRHGTNLEGQPSVTFAWTTFDF